MELKAVVVPTIRPDTLFVPYHYGGKQAINQLTNPAVEPDVKIPEYKVCAATVEKLDQPAKEASNGRKRVTINLSPENAPKMFPYAVGETKDKTPQVSSHAD
jgi:assimilatory nitrate reductase catalytic subunit